MTYVLNKPTLYEVHRPLVERWCAYLRKSQDREDQQVDSIPAQEEWLGKVEKLTGRKVERVFIDTRSAFIPYNRPDFTLMLDDIRNGLWHGVIVISIDRLARNMEEGGKLIQALQTSKLKEIYTAFGVFTPESDSISIAVHFAQANQSSRTGSYKTRENMISKARKYKKWMHLAPLGYKNTQDEVTKEKFVTPDQSFPLVKEIFRLRIEGKSAPYIAEFMRERGLMTRVTNKRKSTLVDARNIYNVLKNPFYCGLTKAQGEWIPGEWEPAVTLEDFSTIQGKKMEVKMEVFYPFRGLIKCGECKTAITSEIKKGITYYHCNGRRVSCSQRKYLREDELDDKFANLLLDYQLSDDYKAQLKEAIEGMNESAPSLVKDSNKKILKRLDELEDEKKQQVRMRGRGEITFEMMQETLKDIAAESEKLQGEISKGLQFTQSQAVSANIWIELMNNLSGSYKMLPYPSKQFILKMIGSNFVLMDGLLALEAMKPPFESVQNTENIVWCPRTNTDRTKIEGYALNILKNINQIELILNRLQLV